METNNSESQEDVLKEKLSLLNLNGIIDILPYLSKAIKSVGMNGGWIKPEVLKAAQSYGLNITSSDFYSIVPDINSLPQELWDGEYYIEALKAIEKTDQFALLNRMLKWVAELKDIKREYSDDFFWDNDMIPPLDAIVYYGMIREFKPGHVLEVGSGYSTEIALRAARKNGGTSISCVEPFPSQRLLSRKSEIHKFYQQKIQDIPLTIFSDLTPGDILFIDSTHTVKAGSDVNYILFQVMPRLRGGVMVHFHDIFIPYEYPKNWYDEIGIIWNEQYAVLSFLMYNDHFQCLMLNYYASILFEEYLKKKLSDYDIWGLQQNLGGARGASLWMLTL